MDEKIEHPDRKIWGLIKLDLENKLKIKEILEKRKISKYIFNQYYRDGSEFDNKIIALKEEKSKKREKDPAQKERKETVLRALKKTLGNVSSACEKANVGRRTFYSWMADDPEFKADVQDIQDYEIDFVESKLKQEISDGNITGIIFYLKTKGKKRGYVEKVEKQDEKNIDPLEGMTLEQIEKEISRLKE